MADTDNKRSSERPDISFSLGGSSTPARNDEPAEEETEEFEELEKLGETEGFDEPEEAFDTDEVIPVIPQTESSEGYDAEEYSEEEYYGEEPEAYEDYSDDTDGGAEEPAYDGEFTVSDRLFGGDEQPEAADEEFEEYEDNEEYEEYPDNTDNADNIGEQDGDVVPVIPQTPTEGEEEFAGEDEGYGEFADNGEAPGEFDTDGEQPEEQEEDEDYNYSYNFPESAQNDEEPPEYVRNEKNRGAGFTMRTSDDRDRSKNATSQPEYTKRGEEKRIAASIARLRSGLTMRAAMLLFASMFSLFITIANDLEAPLAAVFDRTVNPSAYLFTNTILGIISVGFCYSTVTMGIKNLLRFRPDSDSIAALSILISVISGLITLFNPETLKAASFHLYTSVAITGMLFNTLGKLSVAKRAERNFEFAAKTESFYAVQHADDGAAVAYITGGRSGKPRELSFLRKTDFVRDFIKNSYSYDLADLFAEKAGIPILLCSVAVGILSLKFDPNDTDAMGKVFIFLSTMSGTLSLCCSFALSIVVNRPLSVASREVLEHGGVMLGYSSVEEFAETGSVLLDAEQLFPSGNVRFVNLKMLGSTMIDRSIVYAASLAEAGRLFTRPAFERMLGGELTDLAEVNDPTVEEGTGVSGWISKKRMLLGSRDMMKKHRVDGLPSESTEDSFAGNNRVLYLAISGRAAMMFSVKLTADKTTARKLRELQSQGVEIHVRCTDGILSREYIAAKFNLKTDKVHIVPSKLVPDVDEMCAPAESLSASMFCSGKAYSLATLITAAKRVKESANIGIAIQYGELVLGTATAAIMMTLGRFGQVSPAVAIAFNMAFFAVTLLLQKAKK